MSECVCARARARVCVYVCVCARARNELEVRTTLAVPHLSSFCTMPVLYTRTHAFKDSERTGLKVDVSIKPPFLYAFKLLKRRKMSL